MIFDQDKRVVESQRPEQVPFDLAAELHLKFDAVAVAYRRAMRAEGLALLGALRVERRAEVDLSVLRKIRSSSSGAGRGVSAGGSVGAVAGTASRTIRSSPAGVLSTSTRAESLSTRNVCATPIGTTAAPPASSSKGSSRPGSSAAPSRTT